VARKKKKPSKYKKKSLKQLESFTGDTGLIYPVGLSRQRQVRKSKKNYKMVSYGKNSDSASSKSNSAVLSSQTKARKIKKNYRKVSPKKRKKSPKDKNRSDDYWVGFLDDVGIVLYDPGIQADKSEDILLFVLKRNQMAVFDRNDTRAQIEKVIDPKKINQCKTKYKKSISK